MQQVHKASLITFVTYPLHIFQPVLHLAQISYYIWDP